MGRDSFPLFFDYVLIGQWMSLYFKGSILLSCCELENSILCF